MRELDRQQKEQEHNADRAFDMQNTSAGIITDTVPSHPLRLAHGGIASLARSAASRRSSEDSLEDEGRSLRDIKHELKVIVYQI